MLGHWYLLTDLYCELAIWVWEAEIIYEVLDGGPCESLLLSVAHRHGEVVDCRHGGVYSCAECW